jgi:hypothetical protein
MSRRQQRRCWPDPEKGSPPVSSDLNSDSASANPDAIRICVLDGNQVGALLNDDTEPGHPCFSLGIAPIRMAMK